MNSRFSFLFATRFWAMLIGAVSIYLKSKGYLGEAEMLLISTITGGFILVRTADRISEQKIIAAGVESGQVPAATVIEIPPLKSDTLSETTKTQ